MCELVSQEKSGHYHYLEPGRILGFPQGTTVTSLGVITVRGVEYVYQCWHPEDAEWNTMLPPVEGMGWKMPPGSKVRLIPAENAPEPGRTMVEQVEAVR